MVRLLFERRQEPTRKESVENMAKKTLQRKTIYAATIVAILAMAGGYALAASNPFGFAPTATQGQNGYSVTTVPTLWTFVGANASVDPNNACTSSPHTIDLSGGTASALVSMASASGATCSNTNVAENFSFLGTVGSAPTLDIFTVFSYTAASPAACSGTQTPSANTLTVKTVSSSSPTTVSLYLWVDYGAAAAVALCGVDISVSGS